MRTAIINVALCTILYCSADAAALRVLGDRRSFRENVGNEEGCEIWQVVL